jgi:hypothetical protein
MEFMVRIDMIHSFVIVGTGNVLKIQKLLHICSEHDEKKDEVSIDTLYSIIQDAHLPYYIIYVGYQIIRVKYGCFAEHKVLSSGSNNWLDGNLNNESLSGVICLPRYVVSVS